MRGSGSPIAYEFWGNFGRYYVTRADRRLFRDGQVLESRLTPKEYRVLEFFLARSQLSISYEEIEPFNEVSHRGRIHPAPDYIAKINKKLGLRAGTLFQPVSGPGYRFAAEVRPEYELDRQEAADLYRAALDHFNLHTRVSLRAAFEQSLEVVQANPHDFPKAYITRAYNAIDLCHTPYAAELPSEMIPIARQAAEDALAVDEAFGAAYGILGLIALIYNYDWIEAEVLLNRALALDPQDTGSLLTHAHFLVTSGRFKRGLEQMEKAVEIDPNDRILRANLVKLYMFAGDTSAAKQKGEEAVRLNRVFAPSHFVLGLTYEQLGEFDKAIWSYKRSFDLDPVPVAVAALGHLYGKLGQKRLAHQSLNELQHLRAIGQCKYVPAYCEALIYVGLGKYDACLESLQVAYDQRCDWLIHLAVEPRWAPVRRTSRFKKLMTMVNIPRQTNGVQ
jgi:tetratricopeptide (TPR) repeat protein